jgi:hypothetical protein
MEILFYFLTFSTVRAFDSDGKPAETLDGFPYALHAAKLRPVEKNRYFPTHE